MGVLTEAVKRIDTSKEEMSDTKDTLDLMVELTKSKAEEFKREIEDTLKDGLFLGTGDNRKTLFFPITSVKDSRVEYRCITKDTPTNLVDTIADSICDMIEDNSATGIVKGIAKIINGAIQPLLGLSEGSEQYCSSTSTFIEGKGLAMSIVRFDCIIWARAISAKSIKEQIEKTMACVAYKSVVNVKKITFDDFRAVYSPLVDLSGTSNIQEAIKNAKDIYDMLGGGTELSNALPLKASQEKVQLEESTPYTLSAEQLTSLSKAVKVTDNAF